MSEPMPPPYDPAVHTVDDEQLVRVELFCECGEVRRWVDPTRHLVVQLDDWRVKHAGAGHGPTTARKSLTEREARRKAGFRMAGRQAEYEAKDHNLDGGSGFDWTTPAAAGEEG